MEQGLQAGVEAPGEFQAHRLVPAILAGDESAFNAFYDYYCDRLFRYLLVMTRGDEMVARELLQQVFLKVVRYVKAFESDEILWSWLTQLCKTTFVDHVRRSRHGANIVSGEELFGALEATPPEPDTELFDALQTSLGKLDGDERRLLEMIYFEDCAQKDAAAQLGVTLKAIEGKLARVRQRLRKLMLATLKHYALF